MSRYIDADALMDSIIEKWGINPKYLDDSLDAMKDVQTLEWINSAPSIDIVRCQDCKYWVYNFNGCARNPCTEPWYATDFCNYGEREGE